MAPQTLTCISLEKESEPQEGGVLQRSYYYSHERGGRESNDTKA
jgi:hypothetical protein